MGLGFEFQEVMAGTFTSRGEDHPPRRIAFSGKVTADSFLGHLRNGEYKLEGRLDMEGYADDVPILGTLDVSLWKKRRLRYEFSFAGNDGTPYRFAGEKNIRWSNLLGSWTTLLGNVQDASGKEIARCTLRFDLKSEFLPFLVSFRPAVS